MKTFLDFIHRIVKDLKLGKVGPNMQKALELRIGDIVDEQIEDALAHSLTEDDWRVYDDYLGTHPQADVQEAVQAMVTNRPNITEVVEGALISSYDDVMAREEAVQMVLAEADEA
jgi:hypothetical protein